MFIKSVHGVTETKTARKANLDTKLYCGLGHIVQTLEQRKSHINLVIHYTCST